MFWMGKHWALALSQTFPVIGQIEGRGFPPICRKEGEWMGHGYSWGFRHLIHSSCNSPQQVGCGRSKEYESGILCG
jgi:hypothetical protein